MVHAALWSFRLSTTSIGRFTLVFKVTMVDGGMEDGRTWKFVGHLYVVTPFSPRHCDEHVHIDEQGTDVSGFLLDTFVENLSRAFTQNELDINDWSPEEGADIHVGFGSVLPVVDVLIDACAHSSASARRLGPPSASRLWKLSSATPQHTRHLCSQRCVRRSPHRHHYLGPHGW